MSSLVALFSTVFQPEAIGSGRLDYVDPYFPVVYGFSVIASEINVLVIQSGIVLCCHEQPKVL